MKRIIMILTPILLLSGVATGMILNNRQVHQLKVTSDSDNIKNNDVSTVLDQKVYYDDDDANPDLN
ncbi:hypothetical protein FACS1894218_5520 [Bacilli bacterium]|nr:hypothetical protein FACS1894218_5520 [Bacilli bacterium]